MIPSTAIHFNDDGTAWVVLPTPEFSGAEKSDLAKFIQADRPCDTCDNGLLHKGDKHPMVWGGEPAPCDTICPDCINGRHTFEIIVQDTEYPQEWHFTYRVSIVPGMVLEITSGFDAEYRPMVWISSEGVAWLLVGGNSSIITLPPDARPGMWIVLLKVHQ
jgi:hypothetical protein